MHPAMAAAAVKSGTYGSMLNPGLVHNSVIAKLARVQVTEAIGNHMLATVLGMLIAAAVLTAVAVILWRLWAALWAGRSRRSPELRSSWPVLPVSIPWRSASATLWAFSWRCWPACSCCCSETQRSFSKDKRRGVLAALFLFARRHIYKVPPQQL